MDELRIVASIVAKSEYVDDLKAIFEKVVSETRKEEGVVSYDLHQDTKNPLKFVFFEVWKSDKAIAIHNSSAHFKEFQAGVDGKIDSLDIDVIKKIF